MTFWFTNWWCFPTVYCPPKNSDPCFSTGSSFAINENSTFVTKVKATDKDGDALTFSLKGGADLSFFTINPTTGELSFKTAPDFERPLDAGKNNVYNVTIQVSDGKGGYDCQELCIAVKDVKEVANVAPVITTGNLSVAENQTAITTLAATDANGDAITWSISGADAALFNVNPVTGALTWKTAPNFENPLDSVNRDNIYDVTATANDGKGGVTSKSLFITVTNVNEAPMITSGAAFNVAENSTAVATITTVDPDAGATVAFSLSGADAALFSINAAGQLRFISAPNFEAPTDQGGNNVYNVTVTASDGLGGTTSQNLAVTVTDVVENVAPVITSAATTSITENGTAVTTLAATDADGDAVTWSIAGTDAALFTVNAATGALSFIAAPNFEAPADQGGNNVYDITVTASDGKGGVTSSALAVSVTNANEAPSITSPASLSIDENHTAVAVLTSADPDAGATATWSIIGGDDAALFTLDPNTGALVFNVAPDAELPGDVGGDNVYSIDVRVSDGLGGTATQSIAITVNDIAETTANADAFLATDRVAFVPGNVLGNDEVAAGGNLSIVAVNGGGVGGTVAGSTGGTFSIAADGTLSFATGNTDFVGLGAGETRDTSVTYTVSDGLGGTSTSTATVTVTGVNDAPFFLDSAFDTDGDPTNPGPAGGLVNLQAGSGGPEVVTDILFAGDLDLNDTLTFTLSGEDAAFFTIDENPLDLADLASFGITAPDNFTDFATIRPSQFINNLTPASGGPLDFEFNFTVTVTDSSGASISTDYAFVIT